MGTTTITQLPPGTALNGTELFESVQDGQSVRLTAAQIAQYSAPSSPIPVSGGGTGSTSLTGYVTGTGIAPLQGVATIPLADIDGAGTAASKNMAISSTAPVSPALNDLWVDTSSTVPYDPAAGYPVFSDPIALLADTVLSYTPTGAQVLVTAGMPITTSNLLSYIVADASATDADVETAGGVKLYAVLQPPFMGYSPIQFGAVGDGVSDDTVAVRAAAAAAKRKGVGLFSQLDQPFLISDNKGVWFGSDDCSEWVRGANIKLVAAFDGGTLFDLTGIGNSGRDSFVLHGSVSSGFTPSYGVVQARPKQAVGVKSSGNARQVCCNLIGPFLAAAYCSVESESNAHQGGLLYNSIGIAAAWSGSDYFKDTFRLSISGPSGAFSPGEVLTGGTSGATATVLRVDTARTSLFCRALTGTFTNGEVVTGGTSGSTATLAIPDGYIVTGTLSPNATLGIETNSTGTFQTITDCWFNNALGGDLFPTVYANGFNDLCFRAPNISGSTTGDLMEFAGSCAGISVMEPYWHSTHRYSMVFGDAGQSSPNQIFDGATIVAPKFSGDPTARIFASRSNVQLNNANIDVAGGVNLGSATLGRNSLIHLRSNSANPASFTASGVLRGLLEIDSTATVNITSPQNSNKLTIIQTDTGITVAPLRPTAANGIVSDTISLSYGPIILVDTEGLASTDTLSTITVPSGIPPNGMMIRLRQVSSARVITVSITGGNIRGAANVVLDSTSKTASLYYDAVTALWYLV